MNKNELRVLPYIILLVPLDVAVVLAFAVTEAVTSIGGRMPLVSRRNGGAAGKKRAEGPSPSVQPRPAATIQILNWDGKHLLQECLPAVLAAVRHAGGGHEILVVDNGSTDGSVDFVHLQFPEVRVLALDRNYGFGGGNNRGVREVRTDIVVFLNNDMIVDRDFLNPLLDGFADPSVFAVASQIFFADPSRRREETGKTRGRFGRGSFYLWHDELHPGEDIGPVFWAGGGACAVRRDRFLEIGGFDPLFEPAYFEDTDLSYQAWKRGWTCLFEPESRAVHKHRATSAAKFGSRYVESTIRRNQYLFTWKNLTDRSMLIEHLMNLPRTHGQSIMQSGASFEIHAFCRALSRLPQALKRRLAIFGQCKIGDREVLLRSGKP